MGRLDGHDAFGAFDVSDAVGTLDELEGVDVRGVVDYTYVLDLTRAGDAPGLFDASCALEDPLQAVSSCEPKMVLVAEMAAEALPAT